MRERRPPTRILLVAALIALVGLACNAAAFAKPDTAATVNAVYATITAQAGTAGPIESATPGGNATSAPTQPGATAAPTSTPTVSPTPPDARSGNGANLTIARCPGPITVDSDGQEWAAIPRIALATNTYGAANWTGVEDSSGTMRLCWSDSAFNVYMEVTDDVHVQTEQGSTQWKGDEIELLVDGDLRGDYYVTSWNSDDTQLGLSPGDFDTLPPAVEEYTPAIRSVGEVSIAARSLAQNGDYVLEASVPWEVLRITPQGNFRFGLCLALSDNDQTGQASQDSMVSHCSRLSVPNPTTWVTALLAP